jgi:hypothetical protein
LIRQYPDILFVSSPQRQHQAAEYNPDFNQRLRRMVLGWVHNWTYFKGVDFGCQAWEITPQGKVKLTP